MLRGCFSVLFSHSIGGRAVGRSARAIVVHATALSAKMPLCDHDRPQHFLYFRPLPHGQTALRPG
jgi:hypothetical protein